MKPTMEILERLNENSKTNQEEVFTKVYRYLLRPDIYYEAYQHLYANKGASTKGTNEDTADGFNEKKITRIIKELKEGTFEPTPVRRTYIEKRKGGREKRPLGIPTFTDKLVQEVLRMVLESIYEPLFLDCSHGFRPGKSCHTALKQVKNQFMGMRWFLEGDIKGCFDNINHEVLVRIIRQKIADARIIGLIYKFLKAGYIENWQYHNTYSGTPQGGIISPLLANIYLHELDKFVMKQKEKYDTKRKGRERKEYRAARYQTEKLKKQIKSATGNERERLIAEYKKARAEQLKIPYTNQTDKKIRYIRYADDFIIGINGSHEDCKKIKNELAQFINESLKMELSDEKTLITHSSEYAQFLGYNIRVRRTQIIKHGGASHCKKRTLNNTTELTIPLNEKITKFLFDKKVMKQKKDGSLMPVHRAELIGCTDLEIVSTYNAELRGICNYYNLASNFCHLNYFSYMMEYSCLKTLANKHKCSISKIKQAFKDGRGSWGIPYETKAGKKICYFAKYQDCKKSINVSDITDESALIFRHSVNSFEKRLSAKVCELCGSTKSKAYEIHHVNKLKNLKGKEAWEKAMIAKRRKTIVLCKECHNKIHHQ